jgi:hypothetical protein
VRPAALSNPSSEATRSKPVVPRNQPKESNNQLIWTALLFSRPFRTPEELSLPVSKWIPTN